MGPEADCDVIGRVNQMRCWIFSLIKNLHQQRQGNTSCGASCQADLIIPPQWLCSDIFGICDEICFRKQILFISDFSPQIKFPC